MESHDAAEFSDIVSQLNGDDPAFVSRMTMLQQSRSRRRFENGWLVWFAAPLMLMANTALASIIAMVTVGLGIYLRTYGPHRPGNPGNRRT